MNENAKNIAIKYRQAGQGFMILNTLYLIVFFLFQPLFNMSTLMVGSSILYLVLVGTLSFYVSKGKRTLTIILAYFYGVRSGLSMYALVIGDAFEAVSYILPLLLISFYILGRAAWNWF